MSDFAQPFHLLFVEREGCVHAFVVELEMLFDYLGAGAYHRHRGAEADRVVRETYRGNNVID